MTSQTLKLIAVPIKELQHSVACCVNTGCAHFNISVNS